MPTASRLCHGPISVLDYRCNATPADAPFTEQHGAHSISYVRRGTFGYHSRGRSFELVAGAFLIGHRGDEFICTHDHHGGGDECLSFHLTPEVPYPGCSAAKSGIIPHTFLRRPAPMPDLRKGCPKRT